MTCDKPIVGATFAIVAIAAMHYGYPFVVGMMVLFIFLVFA